MLAPVASVPHDPRPARRVQRLAAVIALAALVPVLPFLVVGEIPGERWLHAAGDRALLFGLSGAALLASDLLLPVPSSLLGTALGARLGFLAGSAWTFAGLMAGSLAAYALGRLALGRLRAEAPGTITATLLFVSRPVPVLAEAVALGAGAVRMRARAFLGASAAGNAVYALALGGNGAALVPGALAGPGLILPLAVPAGAWLLWRHHARRAPKPPPSPRPGSPPEPREPRP